MGAKFKKIIKMHIKIYTIQKNIIKNGLTFIRNRIFYFFIFLFYSVYAGAVEVPMDFIYKDKMIDPNCFLESNIYKEVNLEQCSEHKDKLVVSYVIDKSLYGYRYMDYSNSINHGSIVYKYLGKLDKLHVVQTFVVGGSVNRLNYIGYYKIDKGILKLIKRGPSGDRSFGGIENVEIKNGSLYYDMLLTPKLFIENFASNAEQYQTYTAQLSNCAICQFAAVRHINNKPVSIKLNSILVEKNDTSVAKCLNNMHKSYIDNAHLELKIKEAKKFANNFIQECAVK